MTTEDFISELFYRVDEVMKDSHKHPLANFWPSEIVTLGILLALKGVGNRAFYRWLHRDWWPLFPALPERTRLFRLLATHRTWTDEFLATPSVLGVLIAMALNCCIPCEKDGVGGKSGGKENGVVL
jgi:hypothetical protein